MKRSILLLCCLSLFAALSGCSKKNTESVEVPADADTLQVLTTLPLGQVERATTVNVIFDRPMVKMGLAAPTLEEGRRYLRVEPEPKGYYHWVGTKTLSFITEDQFPNASRFRAWVPRGASSLDGAYTHEELSWSFQTPAPKLLAAIPGYPGKNNAPPVRPEDPMIFVFDQKVDRKALQRKLTIESYPGFRLEDVPDSLTSSLPYAHRKAPKEHMVLLKPKGTPPLDTVFQVAIAEGLKLQEGELPTESAYAFSFRTYGPLEFQETTHRRLRFNNPVDADSVNAYLSLDPPVEDFQAYGQGLSLYCSGDLEPGTTYQITVARGCPDLYGQRLAVTTTRAWTVSDRHPQVRLYPETGQLLSNQGKEVLVEFAGVKEVMFRAMAVSPLEEARYHLLQQLPNRAWDVQRKFAAPQDRNLLQQHQIDMASLLDANGRGAVIVQSKTERQLQDGRVIPMERTQCLRWSDLAATTKVSKAGAALWATHMQSGTSVSGAEVTVLDRENRTLWYGRTSAEGSCEFPGLDQLGEVHNLVVWIRSQEGDLVQRLYGDWQLAPYRYGIPSGEQEPVRAFMYSDREIYRPGETIYYAGWVRELGRGLKHPELKEVRLMVRDPQWQVVSDETIEIDASGHFSGEFVPASNLPRGRYSVLAMQPGKEGKQIGAVYPSILSYRAPEFQTRISWDQKEAFAEEEASGKVRGSYFFGAPLDMASFRWTASVSNLPFAPAGFEDFGFGEWDQATIAARRIAEGEGELDAGGEADLAFRIPDTLGRFPRAVTVEATVQSPTGDRVSGRKRFRYHPASVYVGLRPGKRFIAAGETMVFSMAFVDAVTEEEVPPREVTVEIRRHDWLSVKKLLVGGRVGFEHTQRDTLLEARTVRNVKKFDWTPLQGGRYSVRARIKDDEGRENGALWEFYASSQGAYGRPEDSGKLELMTDRDRYQVGETAKVLVSTPIQSSHVWLTIEREAIYEQRLVPVPSDQVFDVLIDESFGPNIYVGITEARGELSEEDAPDLPAEDRRPTLACGYASLAVDVEHHRLQVQVASDEDIYSPRDSVSLSVSIQGSEGPVEGIVGLAVVDEAVLALLNTKTPKPFEFFYADRLLAMRTGDSRMHLQADVLASEKKAAAGGGGGSESGERSEFITTVYWNPRVETDPQGRATVQFRLPDNLTRYRIMAIAVHGRQDFGSGESEFTVTKPLLVQPAAPRFLVQGDKVELAAQVTNRSSLDRNVVVELETGLMMDGQDSKTVDVAAGQTKRVSFLAQAEGLGRQAIRFKVSDGDESDAIRIHVPVVEATREKSAIAAGFTSDSVTEGLELSDLVAGQPVDLEVSLAASAIAGVDEAFNQVIRYPYGCLEQTSSRIMILALSLQLFDGQDAHFDRQDYEAKLASAISYLRGLRSHSSGYSFWPGGSPGSPSLAAYAGLALTQARKAGATVPDEDLKHYGSHGQRYLKRIEWQKRETTPSALPLLVLSELEDLGLGSYLKPEDVSAFAEHFGKLNTEEKLLAALVFERQGHSENLVEQALNEALNQAVVSSRGMVIPPPERSAWRGPFRSRHRATGIALWLASEAEKKDVAARLARGLVDERRQGHWGSTHANSWALLGVSEFHFGVERQYGPTEGSVVLGSGGALLEKSFEADDLGIALEKTRLVPTGSTLKESLQFKSSGERPVYYQSVLRWQENALEAPPEEGGFTLMRSLEPLEKDKPLTPGSLVRVTLDLVVPRHTHYLAIRDPLPAGLEPVLLQLATESREVSRGERKRQGNYPALRLNFTEKRDREALFFADEVYPGVYSVSYLARVRANGDFAHRAATVEGMYDPEWSGSTGASRWVVQP